jgi:hypothetical protein
MASFISGTFVMAEWMSQGLNDVDKKRLTRNVDELALFMCRFDAARHTS